MKLISLTELAQAMGAARQDWQCAADAVVSDSRLVTPGCVFVAIRGENFDGHDFVPQALSAGAAAAVVDHPLPGCGDRLMVVPDTKNALKPSGFRADGSAVPPEFGRLGTRTFFVHNADARLGLPGHRIIHWAAGLRDHIPSAPGSLAPQRLLSEPGNRRTPSLPSL